MAQTLYVLDTNVLIHDPESIFSFDDGIVGIPIVVLEELDKFKSDSSQRGRNSRTAIRYLDLLRQQGSLATGVKLENGGSLQILFIESDTSCALPLDQRVLDNQILHIAYCMKQKGYDVKFISKDLNARVKADVIGIEALDYVSDKNELERVYRGWVKVSLPSVQLKKDEPDFLEEVLGQENLAPNEFIWAESKNNPYNYSIWRYLGNKRFKKVSMPQIRWPLESKNAQQLMALDLLFDDNVQLVSLIGPAGTGKTFLALVAALHKVVVEHEYEKILVTRPVIPLGPDIGFLPGDIQEKLLSWMQPIYDNMDFIYHAVNVQAQAAIYKDKEDDRRDYKYRQRHHKPHKERGIPSLDDLIKENKLSLEAITYMRGRSIPFQFILIDEVQNLTLHEVKTLISRVGQGSKIILAGDPYQIDSPYLDFYSNGLVVTASKFKGQDLFGSVFLEVSERSRLSKLAAELL